MMPLLLFLAACKPDATPTAAASAAQAAPSTAAAVATSYTPTVEVTGSLEPIASVQLGFDVPGRIAKLLVERGATVHKGDAIAVLDTRTASAQLAQAHAAVAGAEAQLAGGEAGWQRMQQMHEAGAVSQQQYTDAEAGIKAARAGIEQARAAEQLASTYLANHTLRAPIDGVITAGPDNAGAMVGGGTPLFYLEDLSALQVKANAPEEAAWLQAGLPATVLSGVAGDSTTWPATVSRVIPALDPQTRRIPVEIAVPAAPGLRAHGYARVRISAKDPVAAWSIPKAALVARPEFCVLVADGTTYTKVPVQVLDDAADPVIVEADLHDGAQVVLNPPTSLGEK